MRAAGLGEHGTPHGWRSCFADWSVEVADADYLTREASLAHVTGTATERAYTRTTLLEKRRALLEKWSSYLAGD